MVSKGSRGWIFLLWFCISLIVSIGVGLLVTLVVGIHDFKGQTMGSAIGGVLVSSPVSALCGPVAYIFCRYRLEGAGEGGLADTFD